MNAANADADAAADVTIWIQSTESPHTALEMACREWTVPGLDPAAPPGASTSRYASDTPVRAIGSAPWQDS